MKCKKTILIVFLNILNYLFLFKNVYKSYKTKNNESKDRIEELIPKYITTEDIKPKVIKKYLFLGLSLITLRPKTQSNDPQVSIAIKNP